MNVMAFKKRAGQVVCAVLCAIAICLVSPAYAMAENWGDPVYQYVTLRMDNIIGEASSYSEIISEGAEIDLSKATGNMTPAISILFPNHMVVDDYSYNHSGSLDDVQIRHNNIAKMHVYDSYGNEVGKMGCWYRYGVESRLLIVLDGIDDPNEQYTIVVDTGLQDTRTHDVNTHKSYTFHFTVGGLADAGNGSGAADSDADGQQSDDPGTPDGTGGTGDGTGAGGGSTNQGGTGSGTAGDGSSGAHGVGDGGGSAVATEGQGSGTTAGNGAAAAVGSTQASSISKDSTQTATSEVNSVASRLQTDDEQGGSSMLYKLAGTSLAEEGAQGGGSAYGEVVGIVTQAGRSDIGYMWAVLLIVILAAAAGFAQRRVSWRMGSRGNVRFGS